MPSLLNQILNNLTDPVFIASAVLLLDFLIGDPAWLYRRIPHPVVIIGGMISLFEKRLNSVRSGNFLRFLYGILTNVVVIGTAIITGILVTMIFEILPLGGLLLIILSSSLIAYRGLFDGVWRVQQGLAQSLDQGRDAVRHIVGRDPKSLDEAGVARASIESLAENFSDGTIAPIFWFLLLGLPGLLFYKAVNTLDSMVGHHSDRYEYFGKFSARLDDVVNFVPARLTGLLIVAAAYLHPRAKGSKAVRALLMDARKHKSVNAGWQEAALAGALGISLAGPRQYGDQLVDDVWMNDGGRKLATAQDIRLALHLYMISGALLLLTLTGLAIEIIN